MAIIEARNIAKTYSSGGATTTALHDVSVSIAAGEYVAVMGSSGSGKSTLLHILGLLERPSSGELLFADQAVAGLDDAALAQARNEKIGFIFQSFHLLPRTSVLDNVILPLQYSRRPRREHRALALAALERVHMTHRLTHHPSQLSGGERQRVAIARALVNGPEVIFADEPTGNLDSVTGEAVLQVIDELHAQGRTIILVTHEKMAAAYARRLIILRDGRVVSDEAMAGGHSHFGK